MPIDLTKLEILDLVTMAKGGKMAPMGYGSKPAHWTLENVKVVFEPGTFSGEESSRVNLVIQPDAEGRGQLEALDEWMISALSKQSDRLVGKDMTPAEVRAFYIPCMKNAGKYEPTAKLKMNLSGSNAVMIWDAEKTLRGAPQKWQGMQASLRVRIKGVYVMNRSFGCILEVTDVMVDDEGLGRPQSCPFD